MTDENPSERPFNPADIRPGQRPTNRWRQLAKRWYAVAGVLAICALTYQAFLGVSTPRESPRRSQCRNNLKNIGLALHNYHEAHGCFPPAFVADANGKPMHSWRVLILPYLDQGPSRKMYSFNEPRDGPNNKKLSAYSVAI